MPLVRNQLTFQHETAESILAPRKKKNPPAGGGNVRDHLQKELRGDMRDDFQRRSGDLVADVSYTTEGYASQVSKYRLKIVGWPPSVPFANFSAILGGVKPIKTLHTAWRKHILCFEPATDEDVANAERDPMSVHPNPKLIGQEARRSVAAGEGGVDGDGGNEERGSGGVVVEALVHHPGTFEVIGVHTTSTRPSVDLPDRPRAQRSDVKRPHCLNGEERTLKRPRDGVKSLAYVLELGEEGPVVKPAAKRAITYWPTNEPVGEFKPATLPSEEHRHRIVERSPYSVLVDVSAWGSDDIESASGFSMSGVSSEIEESGY